MTDIKAIKIIVNGQALEVFGDWISYEEIVTLAGCDRIALEAGMVFSVMHTGNA